MDQSIKIKLMTGVVTLVYCMVPILQDEAFSSFSERFNDHYLFFLSSGVWGCMRLVSTNVVAYVIQLALWFLLWWISYLTVRFLTL